MIDVLAKLKEPQENYSTILDLSSYKLTSLPTEILQLTNLRVLDLSKNQISTLPEVITQLTD